MSPHSAWSRFAPELEREREENPLSYSYPWDEIQNDVRFGWEEAMDPDLLGADWSQVENEVRRRWEQNFPHHGYGEWTTLGEAVRLGFSRVRGRV